MSTLGLPELLLTMLLAWLVLAPVILVLRFVRRGAARSGMTPSMAAVALLPIIVGGAIAELAFYRTLDQTAVTGTGGAAALAGGSIVALMILTISVGLVAPLAFSGAIAVGIGSGRAPAGEPGAGAIGSVSSLAAAVLAAGGVALMVRPIAAVNAGLRDPQAILTQWRIAVAAVLVLGLVALVLFVVPFLRAARGAAPLAIKLLSCAALGLIGVASLAGVLAMWPLLSRIVDRAEVALPAAAPDEPALAAPEPASAIEAAGGVEPAPLAPPGAADPVRVGGAIREPHKVKNVLPTYPDIAKQARVQGVVILECTIGPDGKVADIKVLRGIPLLDAAAVDAVRQWEYTPTVLNGVAVSVIMTVTVNFKLA